MENDSDSLLPIVEDDAPAPAPAPDDTPAESSVDDMPRPSPLLESRDSLPLFDSLPSPDVAAPPVYNKDGSLRKKRGRKPKEVPTGADVLNAAMPHMAPPTPAPELPKIDTRQAAQATAGIMIHLSTSTAAALLGSEWAVTDPEEFKMLSDPLAQYFEQHGITQPPAGVMVLAAFAAYGVKRLQNENTLNKVSGIFERIKIFAIGMWHKYRG